MSETLPPGSPMPSDGDAPRPPGEDPAIREPSSLDRLAGSTGLRAAIVALALVYAAYVSWWLFIGLVGIALTLFIHELAHFLVAKRNGMKVTEFFIGFGPRIWSFRRGETEYGLKVLPAGAYVKIIGMSNLEEVAPEDEARSYRAQSYWKRMPVVLAGPAINIALGIVLLCIVYAGFGYSQASTTVSAVTPGSGASTAGILPGDELVAIDGVRIDDFDHVRDVIQSRGGSSVDVVLVRDGSEMAIPAVIGWGVSEDVAKELGIARGDRITRVGGTDVSNWSEARAALAGSEGPVTLLVDTGRGEGAVRIEAPADLPEDGSVGLLGVAPSDSTVVHSNVLDATGRAFSDVGHMLSKTGEVAGRLFSPSGLADYAEKVANGGDDQTTVVILEPLHPTGVGSEQGSSAPGFSTGSGPDIDEDRPSSIIGIIDMITQVGERAGWAGVLAMVASVNIILGLLNLIPLIPFDGGHIAIATYEAIRGRIAHRQYRVDMAKLLPVTYAILAFVVLFAASAMYLDVVDPQKL